MTRREFLINAYRTGGLAALFSLGLSFTQAKEVQSSITMMGSRIAPAGETEEALTGNQFLSTSWTGSDIVNTGGGTGHVWTGAGSNLPNAVMTNDAGGNGWLAETHSAKVTGTLAATQYYLSQDSLDYAQGAIRFFVKYAVVNIPDTSRLATCCFVKSTGDDLLTFYLYNNGGTLRLSAAYRVYSTGAYVNWNTTGYVPSVGTGYQIEMNWKYYTASPLDIIKIWSEDGSTLLATYTTSSTTSDSKIGQVKLGYMAGGGNTANTYYLDIFKAAGGATQGFLGPRTS